jgi:hypothetical protein
MLGNPEGEVVLTDLDGRRLSARWHKRQLAHETVIEWRLLLDGAELELYDGDGKPTVIALHHWEQTPGCVNLSHRDDGIWMVEIPMAWHSVCAAFSGSFTLEIDVAKRAARLTEDLHVELH